ncbi:MAG: hypothetical protein RH860_05590 [Cytophagales bacterium]
MRIIYSWILILLNVPILAQELSYSKDIAPIILENCLSCHRENGYAPFGLENYEDVKKRGDFIKYVTETRYMPPWQADPHYRSFAHERLMTQDDIEKIKLWVESGMPKGKKKNLPKLPEYSSGSQVLGRLPDLRLKMTEPFLVKGDNKEYYICYKIPYEIERDTFVEIIEFIPGNKNVVHHSSYQILGVENEIDVYKKPYYYIYQDNDRVNDEHEYNYFNLVSEDGTFPKETYHGGWLPGVSPQEYPEGMGFVLPKKGAILIRTLHYSPTPIDEYDQSYFNIFFAEKPIERTIQFAAFKPQNVKSGFFIPADSIYTHSFFVRIRSDVSMLNINPHMHKLGKSFRSFAIKPNGDTIALVNIPKWDFNWQDFYRFKTIQKIPKGSVLHVIATYDNTSKNSENPFFPPRNIFFESGSMADTEEMMRLSFLYLPYLDGDENINLE